MEYDYTDTDLFLKSMMLNERNPLVYDPRIHQYHPLQM